MIVLSALLICFPRRVIRKSRNLSQVPRQLLSNRNSTVNYPTPRAQRARAWKSHPSDERFSRMPSPSSNGPYSSLRHQHFQQFAAQTAPQLQSIGILWPVRTRSHLALGLLSADIAARSKFGRGQVWIILLFPPSLSSRQPQGPSQSLGFPAPRRGGPQESLVRHRKWEGRVGVGRCFGWVVSVRFSWHSYV